MEKAVIYFDDFSHYDLVSKENYFKPGKVIIENSEIPSGEFIKYKEDEFGCIMLNGKHK